MSEAIELPASRLRTPAFARLRKRFTARVDDFQLALAALNGHKLRSGLTMLGIIIGVFTVVAMMALLNGLSKTINKQLGALGSDAFQIQRFPAVQFGDLSPEIQSRKKITLSQFHQFKELLPQAKLVGAEMWEYGKTSYAGGNTDLGTQVAGGTSEFFTINNLPVASGRGYTDAESEDGARVAVIGAAVVDALFPNSDPVGQKIKLGRMELEVIGTIERQGGLPLGDNPDNTVAVPITLFMELYGASRSIVLGVTAYDHESMKKLQDQAVAAFRRVRGLDTMKENDFDIVSNDSLHEMFDNLAMIVKLSSGVMCGLSLLVGGIGVMNIMLVAVTERTREIGLRKALGARRLRVLMQFIIEAILLAGIGGLIGVFLGYCASWIGQFLTFPAEVPLWAVALGIGVSCGVGLTAGIYPAWRASRLDPAVALRDE
ncbi:MAG TPA: ABC transporter permease [Myxococcales bacterium]|nr:ABC transporter permease [Myxococcales bacterium]